MGMNVSYGPPASQAITGTVAVSGVAGSVSTTPGQGTTLATGQVVVAATATLIKAANSSRYGITIDNTSLSVAMYIGPTSGVTVSTGKLLPANSNMSFDAYNGAIYGISASGNITSTYAEEAV